MDRGAWWAIVLRVAKSRTQLFVVINQKQFIMHVPHARF